MSLKETSYDCAKSQAQERPPLLLTYKRRKKGIITLQQKCGGLPKMFNSRKTQDMGNLVTLGKV